MVMHLIDPSLGSVYVGDSLRVIMLILKHILQCWFMDNLIVVTLTVCICCEISASSPPSTTVSSPISGTLHCG